MVIKVKHPGGPPPSGSPRLPKGLEKSPTSASSMGQTKASLVDQFVRTTAGALAAPLRHPTVSRFVTMAHEAVKALPGKARELALLGQFHHLQQEFQQLQSEAHELPAFLTNELAALKPDLVTYDASLNLDALARDLNRVALLIGACKGLLSQDSAAQKRVYFLTLANHLFGVGGKPATENTPEETARGHYDIAGDMLAYMRRHYFGGIPHATARDRLFMMLSDEAPQDQRRMAATVYEYYLLQQDRREQRAAWRPLLESRDPGVRTAADKALTEIPRDPTYVAGDYLSIPQTIAQHATFAETFPKMAAIAGLCAIEDQVQAGKDIIQDYSPSGRPKTAEEKFIYNLTGGLIQRVRELRREKPSDPLGMEALLTEIRAAKQDIHVGDFRRYEQIAKSVDASGVLQKVQSLTEEAITVNFIRDLVREGITFAAATVATAGVGTAIELLGTAAKSAETAATIATAASAVQKTSTASRALGRASQLAKLRKLAAPFAKSAARTVATAVVKQSTFLHTKAAAELAVSGHQSLYDPTKSISENLYGLGVGILEFELMGQFHKVFKEMWVVAPKAERATILGEMAEWSRHKGHELVRDATFFHLWLPASGVVKTVAHTDRKQLEESVETFFSKEGLAHTTMMTIAMGAGLGTPASQKLSREVIRACVPEMRKVAKNQVEIGRLQHRIDAIHGKGRNDLAKVAKLHQRQLAYAEENAQLLETAAERHIHSGALRDQARQLQLVANHYHLVHRSTERRAELAALKAEGNVAWNQYKTDIFIERQRGFLGHVQEVARRQLALVLDMFADGELGTEELLKAEKHLFLAEIENQIFDNSAAIQRASEQIEALRPEAAAELISQAASALYTLHLARRNLVARIREMDTRQFPIEVLRQLDAELRKFARLVESSEALREIEAQYDETQIAISRGIDLATAGAHYLGTAIDHLQRVPRAPGQFVRAATVASTDRKLPISEKKDKAYYFNEAEKGLRQWHTHLRRYVTHMGVDGTIRERVEASIILERQLFEATRRDPTLIDTLRLVLQGADARFHAMRLLLNTPTGDPLHARLAGKLQGADQDLHRLVESLSQTHSELGLHDLLPVLARPTQTPLRPARALISAALIGPLAFLFSAAAPIGSSRGPRGPAVGNRTRTTGTGGIRVRTTVPDSSPAGSGLTPARPRGTLNVLMTGISDMDDLPKVRDGMTSDERNTVVIQQDDVLTRWGIEHLRRKAHQSAAVMEVARAYRAWVTIMSLHIAKLIENFSQKSDIEKQDDLQYLNSIRQEQELFHRIFDQIRRSLPSGNPLQKLSAQFYSSIGQAATYLVETVNFVKEDLQSGHPPQGNDLVTLQNPNHAMDIIQLPGLRVPISDHELAQKFIQRLNDQGKIVVQGTGKWTWVCDKAEKKGPVDTILGITTEVPWPPDPTNPAIKDRLEFLGWKLTVEDEGPNQIRVHLQTPVQQTQKREEAQQPQQSATGDFFERFKSEAGKVHFSRLFSDYLTSFGPVSQELAGFPENRDPNHPMVKAGYAFLGTRPPTSTPTSEFEIPLEILQAVGTYSQREPPRDVPPQPFFDTVVRTDRQEGVECVLAALVERLDLLKEKDPEEVSAEMAELRDLLKAIGKLPKDYRDPERMDPDAPLPRAYLRRLRDSHEAEIERALMYIDRTYGTTFARDAGFRRPVHSRHKIPPLVIPGTPPPEEKSMTMLGGAALLANIGGAAGLMERLQQVVENNADAFVIGAGAVAGAALGLTVAWAYSRLAQRVTRVQKVARLETPKLRPGMPPTSISVPPDIARNPRTRRVWTDAIRQIEEKGLPAFVSGIRSFSTATAPVDQDGYIVSPKSPDKWGEACVKFTKTYDIQRQAILAYGVAVLKSGFQPGLPLQWKGLSDYTRDDIFYYSSFERFAAAVNLALIGRHSPARHPHRPTPPRTPTLPPKPLAPRPATPPRSQKSQAASLPALAHVSHDMQVHLAPFVGMILLKGKERRADTEGELTAATQELAALEAEEAPAPNTLKYWWQAASQNPSGYETYIDPKQSATALLDAESANALWQKDFVAGVRHLLPGGIMQGSPAKSGREFYVPGTEGWFWGGDWLHTEKGSAGEDLVIMGGDPKHPHEGRIFLGIDYSVSEGSNILNASRLYAELDHLAQALAKDGSSITFKISAKRKGRNDACVVYFHAKDQEKIYQAMLRISKLKLTYNHLPLFVAPLLDEQGTPLPGIGFAQNPKGHESFGERRLNAISHVRGQLERAAEAGVVRSRKEIEGILAAALEKAGVDTDVPAFDAGGRKLFPYLYRRMQFSPEGAAPTEVLSTEPPIIRQEQQGQQPQQPDSDLHRQPSDAVAHDHPFALSPEESAVIARHTDGLSDRGVEQATVGYLDARTILRNFGIRAEPDEIYYLSEWWDVGPAFSVGRTHLGAIDDRTAIEALLYKHRLHEKLGLKDVLFVPQPPPLARVPVMPGYSITLEDGHLESKYGMNLVLHQDRSETKLATIGFQETDRTVDIVLYQGGEIRDTANVFSEFRTHSGGVDPMPWMAYTMGRQLLDYAHARGKTLRWISGDRLLWTYPHDETDPPDNIHTFEDTRMLPKTRTHRMYEATAQNLGFRRNSVNRPWYRYTKSPDKFGATIRSGKNVERDQLETSVKAASDTLHADPLIGNWLNISLLPTELPPRLEPAESVPRDDGKVEAYSGVPWMSRILEIFGQQFFQYFNKEAFILTTTANPAAPPKMSTDLDFDITMITDDKLANRARATIIGMVTGTIDDIRYAHFHFDRMLLSGRLPQDIIQLAAHEVALIMAWPFDARSKLAERLIRAYKLSEHDSSRTPLQQYERWKEELTRYYFSRQPSIHHAQIFGGAALMANIGGGKLASWAANHGYAIALGLSDAAIVTGLAILIQQGRKGQ